METPLVVYSPAAQAVMDHLFEGQTAELAARDRARYEERGLVCTNNMGVRMQAVEAACRGEEYEYFPQPSVGVGAVLAGYREAASVTWRTALWLARETDRAVDAFQKAARAGQVGRVAIQRMRTLDEARKQAMDEVFRDIETRMGPDFTAELAIQLIL